MKNSTTYKQFKDLDSYQIIKSGSDLNINYYSASINPISNGASININGDLKVYNSLENGFGVIASEEYSHAEGALTIASGYASHAEGDRAVARGNYSHAEGGSTIASGSYSHAEGAETVTLGLYSHAEGASTLALGYASHVEGVGTVASGSYQHVQGQYNISSSAQSAFIIGNGTSNASRSNLVFAAGNTVQVTGSVIATQGFTGSLLGTAATASFAPNYLPLTGGTISGSLTITNNLTVIGSASIQYISESTLNIGTNLITVNTINPGARFGGLAVIDSGSSPQVSASFLYDSVQDEFIFVHRGTSTSAITSSHFLVGPETYNDVGNELYLTANRIPKGKGNEHLNDSNISDDGSIVSINSNTQITGSLIVSAGILGSFSGSGANLFDIPASGIVGLNLSQIATGSVTASVSPSQFTVSSGSVTEFQVTGTGVTIGNATTDTHRVTGSLNVTGSTTLIGSLNVTNEFPTINALSLNSATNAGFRTATNNGSGNAASFLTYGSGVGFGLGGNAGFGSSTSIIVFGNSGVASGGSTVIKLRPGGFDTAADILVATQLGVSIGTTNNPNVSAMLDVVSTTKGFLPPRTNLTSNISSPAQGLITYLTGSTNEGLYYYNSGSQIGWHRVLSNTGSQAITGSLSVTATTLLNTVSGNTAIGLSTDTSTARLQVRGTGATSATNTLLLQNSSLTNLLTVRDDGSSTLIGRLNITPTTSTTSSLVVTGPTLLSGSFNTISGSVLTVVGSGSAQPVFTVQGSQGELFSVTDSLSGSLFSVNDISGLPIMEVFSDGTTLIGNYLDPMLITTTKNTLTNSGSFTIYSLPTASYDTAFFDYSIKSGSNARAGQIMAIQSGSSVNYTETTTMDFGSTSGVSLGVFVSGSNMVLTGSAATTAWVIKTIVRSL